MNNYRCSALLPISLVLIGVWLAGCSKGKSSNSSGGNTPPPNGSGATYYVSPSGNDNNNGTSTTTPWQSVAKVNAVTFQPGDRILFQGGQTFQGNLVVSAGGSSSAYIEYASYGTGRASIDAGTGTGVYVYDKAYVWIDSLIITGTWNASTQSGNTGSGIEYYTDLSGGTQLGTCHVSYCDVSGFGNTGIEFLSGPADGSQSGFGTIYAGYNSVHDNGICGMTTLGTQGTAGSTAYAFRSVYIGYNNVYNNLGVAAKTDYHSGDGILVGDAGGGTIEHNVAYNNGWDCGSNNGGPAAIWCYDATGLTFQYNEAYGNGTGVGKADGDGYDMDGGTTHCIMQYNYSHQNHAAGFLTWEYGDTRTHNSANICRYNISEGDASGNTSYGAIVVGPGCTADDYYNNTLYTTAAAPVFIYGGAGSGFYNNIFYTAGAAPAVYCAGDTSVAWFLNNDYYGGGSAVYFYVNGVTYTTLSGYQGTHNEVYKGTNYGYASNPSLSNPGNGGNIGTGTPSALTAYTLNTGSPMFNTGLDLTTWGFAVGVADFNGVSIPYGGHYNIGACN